MHDTIPLSDLCAQSALWDCCHSVSIAAMTCSLPASLFNNCERRPPLAACAPALIALTDHACEHRPWVEPSSRRTSSCCPACCSYRPLWWTLAIHVICEVRAKEQILPRTREIARLALHPSTILGHIRTSSSTQRTRFRRCLRSRRR